MGSIDLKYGLLLVLRLVIAGVFVTAALPKIQDPVAFAASVRAFRIVGPEMAYWVALFLPWLELMIGVGVLVPWLRRSSGLLIAFLLAVFIGLHTSAWIRGLDLDCGCFGANAEALSDYRWSILMNTCLLAAMLWIFFARDRLRTCQNAKAV